MEQGASTGESAPAKRRRTDGYDGVDTDKVTRSTIWFDDGNIVIQAESTQFRVHSSVLSMHSTVLKDCFAIPQPADQETVEGCPLLFMPDCAADFELVLPVLYGNDPHVFDSNSLITVEQTAAMMRLGRKYELIALHGEAMRRLQSDFPSDLRAWRKLTSKDKKNFTKKRNLIEITNLAVEQNLLSLLPALFLSLCRTIPLKSILLGLELKDNSKVHLLPQAMHMCLLGRTKFLSSFFHRLSLPLRTNIPSTGCTAKKRCSDSLSTLLVHIIRWTGKPTDQDKIKFPMTWEELVGVEDEDLEEADFCFSCTRSCVSEFVSAQAHFWAQLPTYFGLPKWDNM